MCWEGVCAPSSVQIQELREETVSQDRKCNTGICCGFQETCQHTRAVRKVSLPKMSTHFREMQLGMVGNVIKKRLLQLNVPQFAETGIVFLFNTHQLFWVPGFYSVLVSWANLSIILLPFLSYGKSVLPILWSFCYCSFSSHARILVPLLPFHHLQSSVLSSQNHTLAIGKRKNQQGSGSFMVEAVL